MAFRVMTCNDDMKESGAAWVEFLDTSLGLGILWEFIGVHIPLLLELLS